MTECSCSSLFQKNPGKRISHIIVIQHILLVASVIYTTTNPTNMATLIALWKNEAPDDMGNRKRVIRDTLIEFGATTLFVYFGTLSAVSTGRKLAGQGGIEDVARILPIAFSFGISIMCLAYAVGHITGGHMNPGVSLMMVFQRQMSFPKMICYWLAQFVGATLGSSILWGSVNALTGESKSAGGTYDRPPFDLGATTLDSTLSSANGFLLELMGSFFFYFVISQTALDKKGIADSFFPAIPVGFSLIVVHICLIPVRKNKQMQHSNRIQAKPNVQCKYRDI
jgi:glycerol uptake facilitator-like aquaporin